MQRKQGTCLSKKQKQWSMRISVENYPKAESYVLVQDRMSKAARLLRSLGVEPKLSGYRCLCFAIPMVAERPNIMMKEVYPIVAKHCGLSDARCVERVIRSAIYKAWLNRDDTVWLCYFIRNRAGEVKRPTNKEFIASLAEDV